MAGTNGLSSSSVSSLLLLPVLSSCIREEETIRLSVQQDCAREEGGRFGNLSIAWKTDTERENI